MPKAPPVAARKLASVVKDKGEKALKAAGGVSGVLEKGGEVAAKEPTAKWYVPTEDDETSDAAAGSQQQQPETTSFGTRPQKAFCTRCNQKNMTIISHKIGKGTVIAALASLFILPGVGFMYIMKSNVCKDVEHKCSVCGKKLGRKKKLPC